MLQKTCLAQAKNAESRAFFLNLIGDFYRYEIEIIVIEDNIPFESQTAV